MEFSYQSVFLEVHGLKQMQCFVKFTMHYAKKTTLRSRYYAIFQTHLSLGMFVLLPIGSKYQIQSSN